MYNHLIPVKAKRTKGKRVNTPHRHVGRGGGYKSSFPILVPAIDTSFPGNLTPERTTLPIEKEAGLNPTAVGRSLSGFRTADSAVHS
jgi:hypothetical protein